MNSPATRRDLALPLVPQTSQACGAVLTPQALPGTGQRIQRYLTPGAEQALDRHDRRDRAPVARDDRRAPLFRFSEQRGQLAASVFDALSARVAQNAGYEIGMLAGSVASNTTLGAPDLIVLTMTGMYAQAMRSEVEMRDFLRYWGEEVDRSANMDW